MKEEIWNELYLYLIRIDIGVFKNFKECARSPCNVNHFSSLYGGVVIIERRADVRALFEVCELID